MPSGSYISINSFFARVLDVFFRAVSCISQKLFRKLALNIRREQYGLLRLVGFVSFFHGSFCTLLDDSSQSKIVCSELLTYSPKKPWNLGVFVKMGAD